MKFLQIQKCCIKTTSSNDLSSFIKKMYLNFFAAILIWPIDHAYGDASATSEDCSFVFVNGCPDSVEGGVYFDEIFEDEKEVIIKNQAVIIRQNTTVNRIRVDKCGLLTVQGNQILRFYLCSLYYHGFTYHTDHIPLQGLVS